MNNDFGSINRIGTTENGRVIYQLNDSTGKAAGKMSIPQSQCDVFEKSYNDIMIAAPKLQKFAQTHSKPKDIEKLKQKSKLITWAGVIIGAGIPIYLTRKAATWKQVLATLGGTIAGMAAGAGIAIKTTTPPGAMEMSKATNTLSKLDIQPVIE